MLDLSAGSNIRKTINHKIPSYPSLFNSAIYIASFFHKIFSKIIQTEDTLYNESNKLQKISLKLYNNSRYQRDSIIDVLASSRKIDTLLGDINTNIKKIEKNTGLTLNSSSVIENNASDIHVLLDDLISFINNAKQSLRRSEGSFEFANSIVERMNTFITNTSYAMEELRLTSHKIHDNIVSTIEFQEDVFQKVQIIQQIINEYSDSINDIRDNLSLTLDIIGLLQSQSEAINRILNVINKISKQTNLLSLNANIIAASSAEDSKSFLVVADEIHSLSKETIFSTAEISQIISNINKSIAKSREASQISIDIVDKTQQFGKEVIKNLETILQNARNSINNVQSIKGSNILQAKRIEQVLERAKISNQKIAELSNYNSRLQKEFHQLQELSTQLVDITNGLKGRMSLQLSSTKTLISNTNNISTLVNKIVDISSNIKTQSNNILNSFQDVSSISDQALSTVTDLTTISYQIHSEYNRMQSLTEYFTGFSPQRGGILHVYFPPFEKNISYDPAHCSLIESVPLYKAIFETLVETESGFAIKPLLCDKYTVSQDFTQYTFFLKNNVYFHNGKKLTAEDIKYSFERLGSVVNVNAELFIGAIEGYREFADNKSQGLSGIKVIDDLTVSIKLQHSLAFFLHILAGTAMSILPKSEKVSVDKPIGTGAFKYKYQDANRYILLEKFIDYHIRDLPYLDQVKFIPNRKDAFFDTSYHIIPGHQMPIRNIFADINLLVNTSTEMHSEILDPNSVSYLILNTNIPPFDVKEVRQAIMLCIDRDKMVDVVFNRINKKAESIIPQNLFSHYPRKDLVRYDLNTARTLVRKSNIKLPARLNYYTIMDRFQDPAIDFVLNCISELGIVIDYIFTTPQEYSSKKFESAVAQLIWFADYPDPDNFFTTFASENIDNRGAGWLNDKYIELICQARIEVDLQRRKMLYNKAEEILLDEAVIIPLYYNKYFLFHHYDIICPVKTVFPFYDLKTCWYYNLAKNIKK